MEYSVRNWEEGLPFSGDGSDEVVRWLNEVKEGRFDGAKALWDLCRPKLVSFARSRLDDRIRRVFDEHDLASVTFHGFIVSFVDGAWPHIKGERDLHKVLIRILLNKAADYVRYETCARRGNGRIEGDSAFSRERERISDEDAVRPDILFQEGEELRLFLDSLDDTSLSEVVCLTLEGCSTDEVAEKLNLSTRSVRRKRGLAYDLFKESRRKD